ncbi:MAG: heavy metal translocating P-type ATPase [Rhodospirillales bacterium]|jgi:heavy metal translocating P-type ATPase
MNFAIAHELPKRLRLRLPADADAWGVTLAAVALESLPGVADVRANVKGRSLAVDHDGRASTRAAILAAVQRPGNAVENALNRREEASDLGQVLLSASAVAAAKLLPSPFNMLLTWANVSEVLLRGIKTAATEGLKVEVLDAIAIALPALRGELMTANAARFLLDLGSYIEASTVQRSDTLLRSLLRASPDMVWVEDELGEVVQVPFSSLKGGERVVVGTGETVAVDGIVVNGQAFVDQSTVTGESLPIPKEAGDEALAGSVVREGRLVVLAERVGAATTTGRISRYIQEALDRPSAIQCMSRRQADKRVMITLASGALVFVLTRDWKRLESVFLVDYSCAVKFGTPIAVKSAMYKAVGNGCLVKGGQAIENLAEVDTVVFDKTGTLTHNTLEVTDVHCLDSGLDEEGLLALVASLAEHTSHPIAAAVVQLAHHRHLAHISHEEVDFIVGHGVSSHANGRLIRIGSRHYLEEDEGVSFADDTPLIERWRSEGKSLLYIAADGAPFGLVALKDRVRSESLATLDRLKALGVRQTVMITGDEKSKALQLGRQLGIDVVHYERHPEEKAGIIEQLKAEGRRVAFVGDGVNDGPALMAAHVGIAMPRAADIARATADVVLMEDRLDGLSSMLELAQGTMRLIKSNFRASVGINSAILAGAALGKLSPLATATLHNGTTIGILLRALGGGAQPSHREARRQ